MHRYHVATLAVNVSRNIIVEKDQSTLPDDERSISRNVAKRKYT